MKMTFSVLQVLFLALLSILSTSLLVSSEKRVQNKSTLSDVLVLADSWYLEAD